MNCEGSGGTLSPEQLFRLALADLADLERPWAPAGRIRQALVAGLAAVRGWTPPGPGGCERCGAPVVQPRTGRPRKFCEGCSPRKTRENATIEAGGERDGIRP